MVRERDFSAFDFRVVRTATIAREELDDVMRLFQGAYRQANAAYIEKSIGRLAFLALAYDKGHAAGFAMGEVRVMDLPRLPDQVVSLAGICCIDIPYRRHGLFGKLEGLALRQAQDRPLRQAQDRPWGASGVGPSERRLSCGRMAHPASFKGMSRSPSVVPKPGVPPTAWQREVGQAVADAYGVYGFDPEHFVCKGDGTPIGYPIIDIEAEPAEWEVFEHVDRDRGDSLLGISWGANPPPGWEDG